MRRHARLAAGRRLVGREIALVHRAAALLLEYPTEELRGLLPAIRGALDEVDPERAAPLCRLAEHLDGHALGDLQAQYVETFDLRRRCSLYLTYYAYGDTRKRGVALVEFKQAYRNAGFEVADGELPDHLSVVLEFTATSGEEGQAAGLALLLGHRAGLEILRLALRDAGSPWVDALTAVCATLPELEGEEREAVARLAAEGPPGEEVGLEPFDPPSYIPGARR